MFYNCQKFIVIFPALFMQQTVFATSIAPPTAWQEKLYSTILSSYVVTVSGGPLWSAFGTTQTLTLAPEIQKTYTANKTTDDSEEGEIFFGIQKPLPKKLLAQFGLALVRTGNVAATGNIWDDANPEFNNYAYNYKVKHSHVAVKGKLLYDRGWRWLPWISASAGIGFNNAYDFTNMPLIEEAVPNTNFTSYTTTTLTYTLGAGVQVNITKQTQIGVGYEFADWGEYQLGNAPGQTKGDGLAGSHVYTNSLLFNLTFHAE